MQIYNTILHMLQCNGLFSMALYEVLKYQMDNHNYKSNFRESVLHEQSKQDQYHLNFSCTSHLGFDYLITDPHKSETHMNNLNIQTTCF